MTKDEQIDKLWESSNNGTMREDIVAAYEAGAAAERERCAKLCEQQVDGFHSLEVLCNDVPSEAEEIGEIKMAHQCAAAIRKEQPPR